MSSPIGASFLSINRASRVARSNTSSFPTGPSPLTRSRMPGRLTWIRNLRFGSQGAPTQSRRCSRAAPTFVASKPRSRRLCSSAPLPPPAGGSRLPRPPGYPSRGTQMAVGQKSVSSLSAASLEVQIRFIDGVRREKSPFRRHSLGVTRVLSQLHEARNLGSQEPGSARCRIGRFVGFDAALGFVLVVRQGYPMVSRAVDPGKHERAAAVLTEGT